MNISNSPASSPSSSPGPSTSDDESLTPPPCYSAPVAPHVGKKVVLLTGGAGFIGSHTAQALLRRGDDVVVIDDFNDYYDPAIKRSNVELLKAQAAMSGGMNAPELTVYAGSITDTKLMASIFADHAVSHVCHLAARAGVRPSIDDPLLYVDTNITGTTVLLELARKHGVANFVYASSSSVYGGSKSAYFSEDEDVSNPVSQYAATKKTCELLAHTYSHLYQLPTTGLRFFTVFGERGRPDMAPLMFINKISKGEGIRQFGDGSSSRDYTYVSDIVDGVVRSLDRAYKNEVFNLGKGSGTSLIDFIGTVEKYTGKKANKTILPDQPGDVPYTCASTDKARALLGYSATVSFDEGIRKTVAWYNDANGISSMNELNTKVKVERPARKTQTKVKHVISTDRLALA
ncbi:hypothetical protein TeGR_g3855 [Tetraparma gracilis]|uniref:NAD-dependent epimerase/dehydratase domain-containing protein n=1 Tax=Tetraparma gracilis TaxID=2962635 RepID=A0ABQ6N176_9STRA|nr:hypothetical protein TeGR_g3855 [Tetraparma gracilis]